MPKTPKKRSKGRKMGSNYQGPTPVKKPRKRKK